MRAALGPALLLLAGCGAADKAAPAPSESPTDRTPAPAPSAARAVDYPELANRDCGEVVQFYLEALGGHEWARAALVWNDAAIDAARLEGVFGGYRELRVEWPDPVVEGAAGSLYCTVSGQLTDARDPAKPLIEGTLLLRRVNDVPGATPDQLRWTLRSSTFVEPLARSDGSEP